MESCCYVYLHRNPKDQTPVYVGMGSLPDFQRARTLSARSKYWKQAFKGSKPVIEIVAESLDRESAFELEAFLIQQIGRKDQGSGPLINKTDGGMGMHGCIPDEETRAKISISMSKACSSSNWSIKQSQLKKELWSKPEYRSKYLGSNNCNARAVICLDTGVVYGSVAEAAMAHGKNPRGSTISRVCRGLAKTYLGKRWAYVEEAEKAGGEQCR